MIIYLHGFDSNSPGNHEKVLQLQFIDPDVRLISYSTRHPKHDMQHLLKEVDKMLQLNVDERPLICGVGLGGYDVRLLSLRASAPLSHGGRRTRRRC